MRRMHEKTRTGMERGKQKETDRQTHRESTAQSRIKGRWCEKEIEKEILISAGFKQQCLTQNLYSNDVNLHIAVEQSLVHVRIQSRWSVVAFNSHNRWLLNSMSAQNWHIHVCSNNKYDYSLHCQPASQTVSPSEWNNIKQYEKVNQSKVHSCLKTAS